MLQSTPDILTGMKAIFDDRHAKNSYLFVSCSREMPQVPPPGDRLYRGEYCSTLCNAKVKFIRADKSPDLGYGRDAVSVLVRDYLKVKYPNGSRLRGDPKLLHYLPPPHYCLPGKLECGWMVDIKAAYLQITRTVGWDVGIWPGRYIGTRSDIEDFPLMEHKAAYSILVMAGLPGQLTIAYPDGSWRRVKTWNVHLNMQLNYLVGLLLHSFANFALDLGARYVNTDGAIMPSERGALELIERLANDAGLFARVKEHGAADIRQVGAYKIGRSATWKFQQARSCVPQLHGFQPDADGFQKWARRDFRRLAACRNPYLAGLKGVTVAG